jgi:anti-anti-sigma factor
VGSRLRRISFAVRSFLQTPPGIIGAATAGVLVLLAVVLVVPTLVIDEAISSDVERGLKARSDLRGTLLQALGGLFFIATSVFTWRQLRVSQKTLDLKADEVAQVAAAAAQQVSIAEQAAVGDRLTSAIQLLASEKLESRMCGVYSLRRIASAHLGEAEVVAQLLAAFVRSSGGDDSNEDESDDAGAAAPLGKRKPDVQDALTILAQETAAVTGLRLNLSGADLRRADLVGAILPRVDLREARLDGASLQGARLQDAHLEGASMTGVDLTAASLVGANLSSAVLTSSVLVRTNFEGAAFDGTQLRPNRLLHASFRGALGRPRELPDFLDWGEAVNARPADVDPGEPETDLGIWGGDEFLTIRARARPSVATVDVSGEVDTFTAPILRQVFSDVIALGSRRIVFGAEKVEFCGSAGLSVLVTVQQEARRVGAALEIRNPSRAVLRPLDTTGLIDLFEVRADGGPSDVTPVRTTESGN